MHEYIVPEEKLKNTKKRVLRGNVVSDAMDKSIVVMVTRRRLHRLYKKYVLQSKKFMADDKENIAKVGDVVLILESRKLSKRKAWSLAAIVERPV